MENTKPRITIDINLPPIPTLGYRGLVIEHDGKPINELSGSFRLAYDGIYPGNNTKDS
jgi:hypothetical protein